MTRQARVDEIEWYHEFDFGEGLQARSRAPDVGWHREVWRFVEQQLEGIDFRDRTVLEIGAWEGVSVYRLEALKRTFDIVMCFGVYYHLIDPLYAFAQIRHCCHDDTLVLLDGDVGRSGMRADEVRYRFDDSRLSAFVPSAPALEQLLRVSYLRVQSQAWLRPRRFFRKDGAAFQPLRYLLNKPSIGRAFTVCRPFRGVNDLHPYEPPFGLSAYDERYRQAASQPQPSKSHDF